MSLLALEGRLQIRLGPDGASLRSTRPLLAGKLFTGRSEAEVLDLLPRIYAVCGRAHVAAARAALAAATSGADGTGIAEGVDAESLREHLLRMLLGWSAALGEGAAAADLGAVMALPGGLSRVEDIVQRRLLGCTVQEWLGFSDPEQIRALYATGALAPQFLQWLIDSGHADAGSASARALPEFDVSWLEAHLGGLRGDDFAACPEWEGAPCETGAYARLGGQALVQACRRRWGEGLFTRSVARVTEAAVLLARLKASALCPVQGLAARAGTGFGVVETARGRLVHRVVLDAGVLQGYRVLAPTEWNFHPAGVLAACLGNLPADAAARVCGPLLVEAIDPCVGYDFEIDAGA